MNRYTILIDGEHFNTMTSNLSGAKSRAKLNCRAGSYAEVYDAEGNCVWQVFK
jgi:hypothetical protein